MRLLELPTFYTVLLDVSAWTLIHLAVALAVAKVPEDRFDPRRGWFRPRAFEDGGRIYERWLAIRAWKERLPDGAGLLGEYGFPKKRLESKEPAYLRSFTRETCRAELAHWIIPLFVPLFFLWNKPAVGWLMVVYILVENIPLVAAQRYNRARFLRVLEKEADGR